MFTGMSHRADCGGAMLLVGAAVRHRPPATYTRMCVCTAYESRGAREAASATYAVRPVVSRPCVRGTALRYTQSHCCREFTTLVTGACCMLHVLHSILLHETSFLNGRARRCRLYRVVCSQHVSRQRVQAASLGLTPRCWHLRMGTSRSKVSCVPQRTPQTVPRSPCGARACDAAKPAARPPAFRS